MSASVNLDLNLVHSGLKTWTRHQLGLTLHQKTGRLFRLFYQVNLLITLCQVVISWQPWCLNFDPGCSDTKYTHQQPFGWANCVLASWLAQKSNKMSPLRFRFTFPMPISMQGFRPSRAYPSLYTGLAHKWLQITIFGWTWPGYVGHQVLICRHHPQAWLHGWVRINLILAG